MKVIIIKLLFITGMILVTSCIDETSWNEDVSQINDGARVVLQLKTPDSFAASQSRALTHGQENQIDNIYVLVFDKVNMLVNIVQGQDVTSSSEDSNPAYSGMGTFSIVLEASSTTLDTYNLVVLANVEAVLGGNEGLGFDVSTVDDKSYSAVTAKLWGQIAGAMYPSGGSIPMWGESGQIIVEPGNNTQSLELTRAVARIDVGIGNPTKNGENHTWSWDGMGAGNVQIPFELTEVYVIRPNDRYAVVPMSVGSPSIPEATTAFSINESKEKFAFTITNDKFTSKDIYVPEANILMGATGKPGDSNHKNRMAVVVGGKYNGSSAVTYYRLDFARNKELFNVLRNHLYQFNISAVSGAGYEDVETAYNSLAMNMTVDIVGWNESDISEIIFDGQYYLGVSQAEFTFDKEAKSNNRFSIITDVPGGWEVAGVTDSSQSNGNAVTWISGVASSTDGFSFNVEENNTGVARIAYIHIKAGRFSLAVRVTQNISQALWIKVLNEEGGEEISALRFPGTVEAKTCYVQWSPATLSVEVSFFSVGQYGFNFTFGSGNTTFLPVAGEAPTPLAPSGGQLVKITSGLNAPVLMGADALSLVTFTVRSENGAEAMSALYVRQKE